MGDSDQANLREPIKVNKGQKSKQKQTKGKPSASTAAMTQAAMKNKTIQRELRKNLRILSLEAEISRKTLTASINCERYKRTKVLQNHTPSRHYIPPQHSKSRPTTRQHTSVTPPPPINGLIRASLAVRPVTSHIPEIQERITTSTTRCKSIQAHHRPTQSSTAKVKFKEDRPADVYDRINQWIQTQKIFNQSTGILSKSKKNILAF